MRNLISLWLLVSLTTANGVEAKARVKRQGGKLFFFFFTSSAPFFFSIAFYFFDFDFCTKFFYAFRFLASLFYDNFRFWGEFWGTFECVVAVVVYFLKFLTAR